MHGGSLARYAETTLWEPLMSLNTFGHLFRVTTWGESHGPAIGCTVDGCPPGLPLTEADIQPWLDRRKPGQSKFTTQRKEDKPRLVVLADASMSVRNSARFTFHLVHGLQRLFPRVRTYAFVDAITDVSAPFETHGLEDALGLVFGNELLDVDASSDYGAVFESFAADHLSSLTRRTTLLVLGDARSGGRDPGLEHLEQMRRQCRRLVWLTPEPRYSWALGSCDLPLYSRLCDRVEVVRDVQGLDDTVRALSDVLA